MTILPPPFAWITIPAGQVTLKKHKYDYDYIKADTTFTVPTFQIAKYPITNAQYAKFIEAGGYNDKQWWTEAGWTARSENWQETYDPDGPGGHVGGRVKTDIAWTEPSEWTPSSWNKEIRHDDQPVCGVSWYEAIAFCRWLTHATGEAVTLPTDQQWQRAAGGDDGRLFPWGNEWDATRCANSIGTRTHNRSLVYHYEGVGDSPFGVVDMVGNVEEWCLTAFKTGANDLEGDASRVIRGGSKGVAVIEPFYVTARPFNTVVTRNNNTGLRIVRA
ncbi:MAG: SUMF1/EgtB/PvdO family nonheme iron enzyme [bacterium]|nr:SUMF1/EgtB/PvdO family nonheme iron enzyme [bacterium]